MDHWMSSVGWGFATVCAFLVAVTWLVWRAGHARPSRMQRGIRIELHGVHIVEDRVLDGLWRATLSMTNRSRRPRTLPVLASRATVAAARRVYLAEVFMERDVTELSPGEVAVAWVECALPNGVSPGPVELAALRPGKTSRRLRLRGVLIPAGSQVASVSGLAPQSVIAGAHRPWSSVPREVLRGDLKYQASSDPGQVRRPPSMHSTPPAALL